MERLRVDLTPEEFRGLVALCELELRPLPDELRMLLRRELHDRGLLPDPAALPAAAPGRVGAPRA
ncbi:MAG: hypothetical protein GEU73_07975 [Chloroflexi bacterium]|nr:hypothetical protein [Chloroflexota bacterium]